MSVECAARMLAADRIEPFERNLSGTNAMNWYAWSVCRALGAPMADSHAPGCPWLALQAEIQAEATTP